MPIYDIFSKREKRLQGSTSDVFAYDHLPKELRNQIVQIWFDTLGNPDAVWHHNATGLYDMIVKVLCREYGVFELHKETINRQLSSMRDLVMFFTKESDINRCLDAVELSFRAIDEFTRSYDYARQPEADKLATEAIEELNQRLMEHGVGYQFTNGEIIRVDSELLHAEVVKPALRLLNQAQYAGAQQEFLKAHEHYRHGNQKEALNEALKAFESVMKSICDRHSWACKSNGTAKDLIQACLDNNLLPPFWQSHFSALRSLLESGIPTGRNRLGGHGQGVNEVTVPNHLVAFMLHMTASAIVFLAEADAALP